MFSGPDVYRQLYWYIIIILLAAGKSGRFETFIPDLKFGP
jgi:hypothetical protein